MVFGHSEQPGTGATGGPIAWGDEPEKIPIPVKIVIAGGFGVGKTTLVGSISEIEPLRTEAAMTVESTDVDVINTSTGKVATTVAMDFGRISLGNDDLILYLFGTPGQSRFHFMWDELVRGAIGAVVLIDTSRLADSFAAIDYFERSELPFVVGVNSFDGVVTHGVDAIREALALSHGVPIFDVDVRRRDATRDALLALVQHALTLAEG